MASETAAPSRVGAWLGWIQTGAATLVAVIGAWFAWQLNESQAQLNAASASLKRVEQQIALQQQTLAERESLDSKRIKVYEAVVKSLGESDERMQRVSAALVRAMLEEPLRTELLTVLSEVGAPQVRDEARRTLAQAQVSAFERAEVEKKVDQAVTAMRRVPAAAFSWEDVDYDLFWCESSGPQAEAVAQGMLEVMKAQGAKGRLRVRMLPDSVNARPGYGHRSNVVRFNGGEERQADALVQVGNQVLGGTGSFAKSISMQTTRWYLSAFVCAPRTP
jgi:integrase